MRTSRNRLILLLPLLLLALLGAGAGYLLGLPDPAPPRPKPEPPATQPQPVPRRAQAPEPAVPPATEPAAERPEPLPPRADLPLTRFRRLVLEADTVLELAAGPAPQAVPMLDATLRGLDSRFAPYSAAILAGDATESELRHLRAEASRAFRNPDAGQAAYAVDEGPRVAIWQRVGTRMPEAEVAAPPGVKVPATRRLQERVDAATAATWLEAIEAEYGPADFGREGMPGLDLVVFPDGPGYVEFARRRMALPVPVWSAGFFSSSWQVACAPVLARSSLAEVLRHEMFHALQSRLAPSSLRVPWFSEGSAEWLDKAPPQAGRLRTHIEFAAIANGHLAALIDQGYDPNLRAFMALDVEQFYAQPEIHYLLAYCLVDFLRGDSELSALYFRFWRLMVEGATPESAFAQSLGALDLDELQRRFVAQLRALPRQAVPPRFAHDSPAEYLDSMPSRLGGVAGGAPGEVQGGWFGVLGRLQANGLSRVDAAYLDAGVDALVIAIDHSETMSRPITQAGFDFAAFARWQFALRHAPTLSLTRRAPGGEQPEAVPPAILVALIESVLAGQAEEFAEVAGITVGDELSASLQADFAASGLSADAMAAMTRRELCRVTAESLAWHWGMRQSRVQVHVVDFHFKAVDSARQGALRGTLRALFDDLEGRNPPPPGQAGGDTDWWVGLTAMVAAAKPGTACLFFTDGPNSTGSFGHLETGRVDAAYVADQRNMALAFAKDWTARGLDDANRPARLQIYALPGAEGQGLAEIPAACPQARLDEWWPRFRNP